MDIDQFRDNDNLRDFIYKLRKNKVYFDPILVLEGNILAVMERQTDYESERKLKFLQLLQQLLVDFQRKHR